MAFDGITVRKLVTELDDTLSEARLQKIYQPEDLQLLLAFKTKDGIKNLLLSANPSLPMVYLTEEKGENPPSAPNFCMLLRKHLAGGKVLSVTQPGLERIIIFNIQHLNELGDPCTKKLYLELMGRHSNIILTDENNVITDSIKRIPETVSSVRTVLPGRKYFIPNTLSKKDPLSSDEKAFADMLLSSAQPLAKAIYTSFTGISPLIAQEIVFNSGVDERKNAASLTDQESSALYRSFSSLMDDVKSDRMTALIYYDNGMPREYSAIPLKSYDAYIKKEFREMSSLLYSFYHEKADYINIRDRSQDLRAIIRSNLERVSKKLDLQLMQLKDSEERERFRIYGDLLTTYGYAVSPGSLQLTCENYYDDNKEITIPLNKDLSPIENAKRYYEKYNKLKRTYTSITEQLEKTREEKELLESILVSVDLSTGGSDLLTIRKELSDNGFIKKQGKGPGKTRAQEKSAPLHYVSQTGYDIYVGKNNYQNEEVTFRIASSSDWWFHVKALHGSHVIVRSNGEMPDDTTFEEAARLAAYYSEGRNSGKTDVDYTQRKNLKKPPSNMPGFVIYHTNYSMTIEPDISGIRQIK